MVSVLLIVAGCSTQKNTATNRWWQAFNARYNTYYNGSLAYIDGSLEKENGNKDNYTELLPLYTVANKGSRDLGKGHFDRAIEKSKKAIQRHSIKRRPEWKKSRKKTEKDLEWLSRREYNPFLWKAWMLMGRSQFHKGDFDEAAATFSYMSRLYQGQPAIWGKARAWLAKCYIEQDWLYDAEDVIRNYQRDSMHWGAQKEWNLTLTDYYLHTGDYAQAVPYLHKVIKQEMRKKQKAREYFLLGQLYTRLGKRDEAYRAYRSVIRQNPPYELEFNARIAMTEVMSHRNEKTMISRLKRMALSDNNKDYLDQVYYAMGNIYLNQQDTANAIRAYEKGNEKATRSGIERGVLLLRLGDIYWQQNKFSDARRCYNSAIGMLDRERPDYEELSRRSVVLDELVPYTEAIHLQDSLQQLAAMDEADRNAAIDRVIEALKKKEREERRAQQEQEAAQQQQQNGGTGVDNTGPKPPTPPNQQSGTWYFYNPMAVAQGKATFEQLWGKRENVDNWRRVNKTVVGQFNTPDDELTPEQRDSISRAEAVADSLKQITDSAQNDPHKREYYLKQIPFTPEQMAASDAIIMASLHQAGIIFKDKLNHLPLSQEHFTRLEDQYGQRYEKMDDVYYHLFLLYSRLDQHDRAQTYVDLLKAKYPDSAWTILLSDPYYRTNSLFGTHIEDSLYTATYTAFKAGRYGEVISNARLSEERFPLGANRDKFLFIGGLTKLNQGDLGACKADLEKVVSNYSGSRISEMAGMIINGINAGRRVYGGQFALNDMWDLRTEVLQQTDSTQQRTLTAERNTNFAFLLVYNADSLNENKLLFEMAKNNFTNYMVRNFDITIEQYPNESRMRINGFRNFDEAHLYASQLHANKAMRPLLRNTKAVIISEDNLQLLNSAVTLEEYEKYYAKHFAPIKVTNLYLLTEPTELGDEKSIEDMVPSRPANEEENEETGENVMEEENTTVIEEETTSAEEENTVVEEENTIVEEGNTVIEEETTTTVPEQPTQQQPTTPEQPTGVEEEEEGVYTIEEPPTKEEENNNEGTVIEETTRVQPQPRANNTQPPVNNTQSPTTTVPDIGNEETTIKRPQPRANNTQPPVNNTQPSTTTVPDISNEETTIIEEEPSAQNKKRLEEEEFEVIFTEDIKPATTAKAPANTNAKTPANTKKTPPPIEIEVEDEYYELEGF